MNLKQYKRKMAEMGISRGGFEEDKHLDPTMCPVTALKEPDLINRNASTRADRPPMDPIPKRLQSKMSAIVKARNLRRVKSSHS